MANFGNHATYLVCYDVSDPYRQAVFRQHIRQYSITGQYSAYECELTQAQRRALIGFLMNYTALGEEACGVIRTHSLYWQNLPKSPVKTADADNFLYIG